MDWLPARNILLRSEDRVLRHMVRPCVGPNALVVAVIYSSDHHRSKFVLILALYLLFICEPWLFYPFFQCRTVLLLYERIDVVLASAQRD